MRIKLVSALKPKSQSDEVKSYMELFGEGVKTVSISTQIPIGDKNKLI